MSFVTDLIKYLPVALKPAGISAAGGALLTDRPGRRLHVGTRTGLFGATISDGTNLQLNSRTTHYIPIGCRSLQFGWSNIWVNAGTNPYESTGTIDITTMTAGWFNSTQSSSQLRLFFGSEPSTSIKQDAFRLSDPAGTHLNAGDLIQVVAHVEVVSSTPFYRGRATFSANGERSEEGVTVTDKSMGGTISTSSAFSYLPQVIVGVPDNPLARSVLIIGDSISEGGSGSETANATTGVIGYPEKGLGILVPNAKFTRSGDKMRAWAVRDWGRLVMGLQFFTDAFVNLGTNDFYAEHRTLAQLKADALTVVNPILAAGLRVTMPTLLPITTGAWSLADGSDQTVTADEQNRLDYNAWLLAGGIAGVRVIDIALLVSIPGNPSKWRAGYTSDGLHPNNTGATAAAAGHSPSLYGY